MQNIEIPVNQLLLKGILSIPQDANAMVIFAHGSGSGRLSSRNQYVAHYLNQAGLATLLFDLLTAEEEMMDDRTAQLRFDIPMLAKRLVAVTDWLLQQKQYAKFNIGYFGASTGAGAALIAAAERPKLIKAVVSRGGRPDLAGDYLPQVKAPTLLVVGGLDDVVIKLNREAQARMQTTTKFEIVPGATHLFEEPGTLDEVNKLACQWFKKYLL